MVELTWTLLQPSNVVLILLLASAFCLLLRWHSAGRRTLALALFIMVAAMVLPVDGLFLRPLEDRAPRLELLPEQVDGILVLGGAVQWQLVRSREQLTLNDSAERVMAAVALAERYPEAQLVFTGVYSEAFENEFEGNAQALFLGDRLNNGRVKFIGIAHSTFEEAIMSVRALKPKADERWLLVTSARHMPRAFETFRTQGWTMTPYPVDYRTEDELTFSPEFNLVAALHSLNVAFREWGALVVYYWLGRTQELLPRFD